MARDTPEIQRYLLEGSCWQGGMAATSPVEESLSQGGDCLGTPTSESPPSSSRAISPEVEPPPPPPLPDGVRLVQGFSGRRPARQRFQIVAESEENVPAIAPSVPIPACSPPSANADLENGGPETGAVRKLSTSEIRRSAGAGQVSEAHIQWLGFLFVETTALWVLQIGLSLTSGSLVLWADIGHSSTDVFGYAVNFWAEKRKKIGNAHRCSGGLVDLIGSCVSLVVLCASTVYAVIEAVESITGNSSRKSGQSLGSVLLGFSAISLLANGATLFLYKYWRAQETRGDAREMELDALGASRPRYSYVAPKVSADAKATQVEMPPMTIAAEPPERLNLGLKGLFAKPCTDENCQDEGCAPEPTGGKKKWTGVLHMLVHPGCKGHHGEATPLDQNSIDKGDAAHVNLNMRVAMLHLIADVFRSITILVAAILIKGKLVVNPDTTDAVCAILVSGCIALGSLVLIVQMLRSCRLLKKGLV